MTPSRTMTGEAILFVAPTSSTSISVSPLPTVTGGGSGVTWTIIPPLGNFVEAGATRMFFAFWGHGTFDGTDLTITFNQTVDWTCHLIDWANTKTTHPFINMHWTPLAGGNTTTMDLYQQTRIGSNNALGVFAMHGNANEVISITNSDGTSLRDDAGAAFVLSVKSFWKASDFTGDKVNLTWVTSSSSGGYMYEVQATDSTGGPNANWRWLQEWADASGTITTAAFTPQANEIIIFYGIEERTGGAGADFTTVVDGSANAYSKLGSVLLDSEHMLFAWAFRYGASPPTGTTITGTLPANHTGAVGGLIGLRKYDNTALGGSTNTDFLAQAAVTNTTASGTTVTGTLTGVATNSAILAIGGNKLTTDDNFTFEAGWVSAVKLRDNTLGQENVTAGSTSIAVWNGSTDPTCTLTANGTTALAIIMLEIA